jgi:hypothetical protein
MRILLLTLILGVSLLPVQARLGETLEQCTARYCAAVSTDTDPMAIGEKKADYKKNGYIVEVIFYHGKVAREVFGVLGGRALSDEELETLLESESSSDNSWLEHDVSDVPRRVWVRADRAKAVFNGALLSLETDNYLAAWSAKQKTDNQQQAQWLST